MVEVFMESGASGKELASQRGRYKRCSFDPWVGKIPWRWHGNPLQYSCLENPKERGAWRATVHRVTMSQTQLKRLSTHISRLYFHSKELGVDHLPSHHWGHFLNKSLVLQSLVLENSALERNYVGSLLSDRGFRR